MLSADLPKLLTELTKIGHIFRKNKFPKNLKIKSLRTLRRLLIILVGLMMTWYSEKIMISTRSICGFMPNLSKKYWMVSTWHGLKMYFPWLHIRKLLQSEGLGAKTPSGLQRDPSSSLPKTFSGYNIIKLKIVKNRHFLGIVLCTHYKN